MSAKKKESDNADLGLANPADANCGDKVLIATGYLGWRSRSLLHREVGFVVGESTDSFYVRFPAGNGRNEAHDWMHKSLIASVLCSAETRTAKSSEKKCKSHCCCCCCGRAC